MRFKTCIFLVITVLWSLVADAEGVVLNQLSPRILTQDAHSDANGEVVFSPSADGRFLATLDYLGIINIWETANRKIICKLNTFENLDLILINAHDFNYRKDGAWSTFGGKLHLAWSLDGKKIVTTFYNHTYVVWEIEKCGDKIIINENGEKISKITEEIASSKNSVYYMATLSDGRVLLQSQEHLIKFDPFNVSRGTVKAVEVIEAYSLDSDFPDFVATASSDDGNVVLFSKYADRVAPLLIKRFKEKTSITVRFFNPNEIREAAKNRQRNGQKINIENYFGIYLGSITPCFALSKNGDMLVLKSMSNSSLTLLETKTGTKITSINLQYTPSVISGGFNDPKRKDKNDFDMANADLDRFRSNLDSITFAQDGKSVFLKRSHMEIEGIMFVVVDQMKLNDLSHIKSFANNSADFPLSFDPGANYLHYQLSINGSAATSDVLIPNKMSSIANPAGIRAGLLLANDSLEFIKFGGGLYSTIKGIALGATALSIFSIDQGDMSLLSKNETLLRQESFFVSSVKNWNFNDANFFSSYSSGSQDALGARFGAQYMKNEILLISSYHYGERDYHEFIEIQAINYTSGKHLWADSLESDGARNIQKIYLSEDGAVAAVIASAQQGKSVYEVVIFYDIIKGKRIDSIIMKDTYILQAAYFSGHNKFFLEDKEKLRIYEIGVSKVSEVTDAVEINKYNRAVNLFDFVVFLPDSGALIVGDCLGKRIKECDDFKKSDVNILSLPVNVGYDFGFKGGFLFDYNRKALAIISDYNEVTLFDMNGVPKVLDKFLSPGPVTTLSFSESGDKIAVGSGSGSILIRDIDKHETMLCIYMVGPSGWVVVDKDGRFDASNLENLKFVDWIIPGEPLKAYPVELFFSTHYQPGLYSKVMQGIAMPPIKSVADINKALPIIKITSINKKENSNSGFVDVSVEVASTKDSHNVDGGVREVRLFRSGQLVGIKSLESRGYSEKTKDGSPFKIVFENIALPKSQGKVFFGAYALNKDSIKSETYEIGYEGGVSFDDQKRHGKAFVITVGVDVVQNDESKRLDFAASDAIKINNSVTANLKATGQYKDVVSVSLVSNESQRNATKSQVKNVFDILSGRDNANVYLKGIAGASELSKSTPDDLIIFSYSGHGVKFGDEFYLIPRDYVNDEDPLKMNLVTAISSADLADWVVGVDAKFMSVIIDACNSAGIIRNKKFVPAPVGGKGFGQLAYDKGIMVLAASQENESALESKALKQGLLTYALIVDGLEFGKADIFKVDGQINLIEWLSYAARRVPAIIAELNEDGYVKDSNNKKWIINKGSGDGKSIPGFQQPVFYGFIKNQFQQPIISVIHNQ